MAKTKPPRPTRTPVIGALAALLCCSPPPDHDAGRDARSGAPGALAEASSAPAEARSVRSGVYTLQQAARGREAYREACSDCHLPDLAGNDLAPPLRGAPFLEERRGSTVGSLYALVRSTMPQDAAFSLEPRVYADIVAYILSENELPPGSAELEPLQPSLDVIAFDPDPAANP